jgi:outer membrane lipoprotein-sorting protein
VRHVWVDAATGLVVRTELARKARGREVVLKTVFGDYRKTAGVAFARSIETGVPGRPRRLRIVVETVEVNPALDDSRFQMPR